MEGERKSVFERLGPISSGVGPKPGDKKEFRKLVKLKRRRENFAIANAASNASNLAPVNKRNKFSSTITTVDSLQTKVERKPILPPKDSQQNKPAAVIDLKSSQTLTKDNESGNVLGLNQFVSDEGEIIEEDGEIVSTTSNKKSSNINSEDPKNEKVKDLDPASDSSKIDSSVSGDVAAADDGNFLAEEMSPISLGDGISDDETAFDETEDKKNEELDVQKEIKVEECDSESMVIDNGAEQTNHHQDNIILTADEDNVEADATVTVKLEDDEDKVISIDEAFENGSNYSEWSDGEDDILQCDNQTVIIKEEIEDDEKDVAKLIITGDEQKPKLLIGDNVTKTKAKNIDLEAISDDDDLDSMINNNDDLDDEYDNNTSSNSTSVKRNSKLVRNQSFESSVSSKQSSTNKDTHSNNLTKQFNVLDTLEIDWKSLICNNSATTTTTGGSNTNTNNNIGDSEISELVEDSESCLSDSIQENQNQSNNNTKLASSRKRNSSALSLLNKIGFSEKFAGPILTAKINQHLCSELEEHESMLHPLPVLHNFLREQRDERRNFFLCPNEDTVKQLNGYKDRAFLNLLKNPTIN